MPKAWVWGRSLGGIVASNTGGGMDVCFEGFVLSDVSALGRSLVQSSPVDCGVSSECNLEISKTKRPRPIGALELCKIQLNKWLPELVVTS